MGTILSSQKEIGRQGEEKMMKKNNPRIKENITMVDKANVIDSIVSSYFTDGEYTPYFVEMSTKIAVALYCMEGIEFEDDSVETIYDAIISDSEVMQIIEEFTATKEFDLILKYAGDKVDFLKEKMIHNHADMDKIIKVCDIIIDSLENFSKLRIGEMSKEDMENSLKIMRQFADKDFTAEDIVNAIKDATGFNLDEKTKEILDAKNKEIRELKKYKALWESRNVTNSDKIVPMKG